MCLDVYVCLVAVCVWVCVLVVDCVLMVLPLTGTLGGPRLCRSPGMSSFGDAAHCVTDFYEHVDRG